MLWFKPTNTTEDCLAELHMVANHKAKPRNGRYNYGDIFFPSSPCSVILELKNASLEGIWRGSQGTDYPGTPTDEDLEKLREILKVEEEQKLLKRNVQYWKDGVWVKTTVDNLKTEGSQQVTRYMNILEHRSFGASTPGVFDRRVACSPGQCQIIGYVVVCIGGTRVLASHVKTETVQSHFSVEGPIA